MIITISVLASLAAFLGGWLTLRFKDKLHIILGLSAGLVIGAALFDLIPEALELTESVYSADRIISLVALGILVYLILDRVFSFHHSDHEVPRFRGALGAASFCLHSLIDGLAIGLSFQVSAEVGLVVSIAVIAHRFSDGINTVGLILKNQGKNSQAFKWLWAVALAPIIGAFATLFISLNQSQLGLILAVLAGFFIYIAASDLIPEGHHSHSKILTTIMTIVGAGFLYFVVSLASI